MDAETTIFSLACKNKERVTTQMTTTLKQRNFKTSHIKQSKPSTITVGYSHFKGKKQLDCVC